MKFSLTNENVTLNLCRSIKQSGQLQMVSSISYKVEIVSKVQIEEGQLVEALTTEIMNFDNDGIEKYGFLVVALEENYYWSIQKKLELDMQHGESPPENPSIMEAIKLEIKVVPPHLIYLFLGIDDTLKIIIEANLSERQVEALWQY